MAKRRIIGLLSDFGLRDAYVAEMKATILAICSSATLVDISHEIRKFDVRMGAFVLAEAAAYFPVGTVNMAIVDPEVGTRRRPIIVEARRCYYVGPDNGLLMLSAKREGIRHIYEITNPHLLLKPISRTFHGRDIFSPVTAHLAVGVKPSEFGSEVYDPFIPTYTEVTIHGNRITGEIIHIDDFGNLITNITIRQLTKIRIREGDAVNVIFRGENFKFKIGTAYSEVSEGSYLTVIGSDGFLEVSINKGNAAKFFDIQVSEKIIVESV